MKGISWFYRWQPIGSIEKLHAKEQSFINYIRLQSPQIQRHLAIE
jgi:hypothetical protein